jgi:hypothetical protein
VLRVCNQTRKIWADHEQQLGLGRSEPRILNLSSIALVALIPELVTETRPLQEESGDCS